jgi:hypothetical protein
MFNFVNYPITSHTRTVFPFEPVGIGVAKTQSSYLNSHLSFWQMHTGSTINYKLLLVVRHPEKVIDPCSTRNTEAPLEANLCLKLQAVWLVTRTMFVHHSIQNSARIQFSREIRYSVDQRDILGCVDTEDQHRLSHHHENLTTSQLANCAPAAWAKYTAKWSFLQKDCFK